MFQTHIAVNCHPDGRMKAVEVLQFKQQEQACNFLKLEDPSAGKRLEALKALTPVGAELVRKFLKDPSGDVRAYAAHSVIQEGSVASACASTNIEIEVVALL